MLAVAVPLADDYPRFHTDLTDILSPEMILKTLLSLLIFTSVSMPIALAEHSPSASSIDTLLASMSNEEKAAQLILVYFSSTEFVASHGFGGVLVMQNMIKDLDQLSSRLQRLQQQSKIGVLVTIDQEGGKVNRLKYLPGWKHLPSAKTMSHWPTGKIEAHNRRVARILKRAGIHLNLAPVLDPSHNQSGEQTLIGFEQRAFGKTGDRIFANTSAVIRGFHSQGILTIAKHFPGYNVAAHSDHEIAISHATKQDITRNAETFGRVAPQVDGVMISSIQYQKLDSRPAVLSPRVVAWARQIYPDKLIITDDLWGVALRSWINPKAAEHHNYPDRDFLQLVRMTLDAGNDLLMITYPQKALVMKQAIAKWMQTDPELREKVNHSVRRILLTKARANLIRP